jgi:hypothetical protein
MEIRQEPLGEDVAAPLTDLPEDTVTDVFDLWCSVHGKKRAVLTPDRRRKIQQAIKSHGAEMVREAIYGCALSGWHMGENPRGKKYNDISLILRNAEKIENFADLYVDSLAGGGFIDDES